MAELVYIALPTNNCARVMIFLDLEGHQVEIKSPKDYGGLKSERFLEVNPQGPDGMSLYESQVILDYLVDKLGSPKHDLTGQEWMSCEERAKMRLMIQVHDCYIGSPNAAQAGFFSTQAAFYKTEMCLEERNSRIAEFKAQLSTLDSMLHPDGPFVMGSRACLADCVIFPTIHMLLHCSAGSAGWTRDDFFGSNARLRAWYETTLTSPGFETIAQAQTEWQTSVMTAERLQGIRDQLDAATC